MARLLCTIEGRNTIEIYNDGHAEILMANNLRAMIDAEDVDKIKDTHWYFNSRTVRNNEGIRTTLNRFILDAQEGTIVRFSDGNPLNCRKSNLRLCTKEKPEPVTVEPTNSSKTMPSPVIIYKDKGYAEIITHNKKSHIEVRVKIDLDDVDKIKDMHWTYNSSAIQNNNGERTVCLHRYIMNASSDVYVKFKNNDKTDCRKANLYFESKYKNPVSKPVVLESTTKNPKGVSDIGNGRFFVSVRNEKTGIIDDLGAFSNKEEACLAYEKRVRKICEELAKDAYESLVASLMEQYYE